MTIADALLQELEQEAKTTRRVLERVPEDKLREAGAEILVRDPAGLAEVLGLTPL